MGSETLKENRFDSEIRKVRDEIYGKISSPCSETDANNELLLVESARDQIETNGKLQMWPTNIGLASFASTIIAGAFAVISKIINNGDSIAPIEVFTIIMVGTIVLAMITAIRDSGKARVRKMWVGKAVELILMYRAGNGTSVREEETTVKLEEIKIPESSSSLKVSVEIQRG